MKLVEFQNEGCEYRVNDLGKKLEGMSLFLFIE